MKSLLSLLGDPTATIAVVGATDAAGKFGGIIYRNLKGKGYRTYAVNPGRTTVDGDPCYGHVSEIVPSPVIVDFVVPPDVTLAVLEECLEAGLTNVWLQPGSEDEAVLSFVQSHAFNYLADTCIMVETSPLP